ncbi:hypothetical protein AB6A40_000518 [Gnathostoma spinigerum]|uniref:EFR3-like protein n=1 Tax=Gnathostoma spinigerum TaxID=75299 RepID=A0ABD6E6N3_9BILA
MVFTNHPPPCLTLLHLGRYAEGSSFYGTLVDLVMDGAVFCCAPCKPRYRRLVDAIYPRSLNDGLVTTNMQKLTFYAISQPEKLGRIGEYIVLKLSRDLYHLRYTQVKVSVDAMDQLLQSCHDLSSLNQFIESFLKMLQKLLETNNVQMEKYATDSFVNFANIEENTPAYHRQYDFFISKFAEMCHSNQDGNAKAIRYAGLRGLRGVLWKSAADPLQASIWEKQHMDKIVPSILFNLQSEDSPTPSEVFSPVGLIKESFALDGVADTPKKLADQFLRELVAKAPFGLFTVLEPVLKHMDNHKQWQPPATFAVFVFRAIMYSVKDPSFVIQALITHLENMSSSNAYVRIGIATVLSSIVSIAGTSIGPSLLGIFNSLLKHLRQSVEFQQSEQCPSVKQEKIYQEALINAMGDYANALPDYQKVEIMMFTVGNIPKISGDGRAAKPGDVFLQHVLVKTLLKIATKYKSAYLSTVFTDSFLSTLLQLVLVADPNVRLDTQRIFHTLLDRHDNLGRLEHLQFVVDVADLQLSVEKCSRADQMFMTKHIHEITGTLFKSICLVADDVLLPENMDAILCTMALLCIEVGFDEVLMELFRLSFAIQTAALEPSTRFSGRKRVAMHNLVAKYLNLSSQLMAIPSLCQHVQQVVKQRSLSYHASINLLPDPLVPEGSNKLPVPDDEDEAALALEEDASLLFEKSNVAEMLKASGKDVQRLLTPLVSKGALMKSLSVSDSALIPSGGSIVRIGDKSDNVDSRSLVDDGSLSLDLSMDWSPPSSNYASRRSTIFLNTKGVPLVQVPLTVELLRSKYNAPIDPIEEEKKEQERTQEIVNMFRNRPFGELVQSVQEEHEAVDLSRTAQRLIQRAIDNTQKVDFKFGNKPKSIFELELPVSFVY